MNETNFARRWARLMLLGCAAVPAQARAGDTDDQAQPVIVVTGARPDEGASGPGAHESVDAATLRATNNVVNVEDSLR